MLKMFVKHCKSSISKEKTKRFCTYAETDENIYCVFQPFDNSNF